MLYYIFHSAFVLELEKNILIFDYYKIPSAKKHLKDEFLQKFVYRSDKNIYIFSSHSHSDHFNPEILTWNEKNQNIKYIFSDDIICDKKSNITFVKAGDHLKIDELDIYVFSSTDLGVSFYINVEGKNYFHPGDLHFWHWPDDTKEEENQMKKMYLDELEKLKKLDHIHLAFVLVDPRLEENVYEGADIFYSMLKPDIMVPIHFGHNYSALPNFVERFKNEKVKIIEIKDFMCEIY